MTSFLEQLKAFEGRAVGPSMPAPDAVNLPMIRHWVEALGDDNPVYVDHEAAKNSVHGEIIAPPTMLQAWIMRPAPGPGAATTTARAANDAQDELLALLDGAGFTSVVATDCEQRYVRMLHLGDQLTVTRTIETVSDEKRTALGHGHFVTTLATYRDQDGETVATMRFRILKFRPTPRPDAAAPRPRRPRPAITRDSAFFFDGLAAGTLLIQRCAACGALRHPPGPVCPTCRSFDWDAVEVSGRGTVYSYVVNHHPQVPAFDYPLVVALIELDEGVRLVSNVVGCDPADVRIGMPVVCEPTRMDDDLILPQFRRAD